MSWDYPYTDLTIRTWRHIAKYVGAEAGPEGAWKLPWLMEDVFEAWERSRKQPQFKAEYLITYGNVEQLGAAGLASAAVLLAVWPANAQMSVDLGRRAVRKKDAKSAVAFVVSVARLPLQVPLIKAALRA